MKRTTTITKTATAPTGHPHPLLTADAIAQTRQRADQLAEESADRYIARNYPLVAELLNDGACPAYRDCTVTEPGHYDHSGHDLKVCDERDTSTVLDAGMVALSGDDTHAIVYVGVAEYTNAAALKAKTAELRQFLDQVDALADRVFADHEDQA